MTRRGEYQAQFREAMSSLRHHLTALGLRAAQKPSQELLADLELPWRALTRARAALLGIRGLADTTLNAEDLYGLAIRIYRGLPQDDLCGSCISVVAPQAERCPFCGVILGEAMVQPEPRVHRQPKLPPPDVSPGKTPRPPRPKQKPATGRHLPHTLRELAKYARRAETCKQFPFSNEQLAALPTNDLRIVAAALLDGEDRKKGLHLARMPSDQLRQWIAARQPSQSKDPGPSPLARKHTHRRTK